MVKKYHAVIQHREVTSKYSWTARGDNPQRAKFYIACGGTSAKRKMNIFMLREAGLYLRQISALAGITKERVRQILHQEEQRQVSARHSWWRGDNSIVDATQPDDIRDEWVGKSRDCKGQN